MHVLTQPNGRHTRPGPPSSAATDNDFIEDVLAAAGDWVWETSADLTVVRLSPTFTGNTALPGEVVGRSLEELLLHFRTDDGERNVRAAALTSRSPFRNLRLRLWDGEGCRVRHFLLSGRPFFTADEGFAGYRGIGLDVTEQAERDSRVSESRFRAIFDHAALGIAVVSPGGYIAQANPALVAMFNMKAADLAATTFAEITHPDDRAADAEEARRLVRREIECYSRENRYLRRDGSSFWGRLTASLVPDESAERLAVVTIEDIDHRKRAEANLELFGKVMDAAHEAVVILSPSGHILYANSAYGRLFEVPRHGITGSHYRNYFPASSQETIDRMVAPALLRGESWEGVIEAEDATGRNFPMWQRAGVVRDEGGRVRFFFAFMHDHTAQQTFQDELYDAKVAAEEANVAKTRFLAAASHDLRQPMQALGMFVAVLAGRAMDPEQAGLVSRIQDSVVALEGLLNGLLDVSKLEAGLVVPHIDHFAVGNMIGRLAAEFEPLCAAEGLTFKVVPCRHSVKSDASLLERILRNFLNNAVRYTTHKGRILFGCRQHGNFLRFEIWDTGIGIPAAELKNIFREFHQVGNLGRDRRQGLGLGLAIVERLANLLGHVVDVASVEGQGSVFSIEVPLAIRATAHRPRQLPLGLARRGAAILVIDDEPDVREGLELLLDSWGHHVVTAASADEAIRRLPALGRDPDLIIADYRLQNGDTGGQAITRVELHLRAETKVPAIILTGDTAPERLQQAQAVGHWLLHKPVQPDALRAAIEDALADGASRRRRAARGARKSDTRKAKPA